MNISYKDNKKKHKSVTLKTLKKLMLKKNTKTTINQKLPNLKGVTFTNLSRNKSTHKKTMSNSSTNSKNSVSNENKTFFIGKNNRTLSFNTTPKVSYTFKNNKPNINNNINDINNNNIFFSPNLSKKKSVNIMADASYINAFGKNKNRTIFNIFKTSIKNNTNNINNQNNLSENYKFKSKKSNSNKNLYSINLNSINSPENSNSDRSVLTFNSPNIHLKHDVIKINKINQHKSNLRNLKLSLLNPNNIKRIGNGDVNSANNDFISYSTNLYSSNDNKFLINNNKNYTNNNNNFINHHLIVNINNEKINDKNIKFLNKFQLKNNYKKELINKLINFKDKMLIYIDNRIDKFLKYDSKKFYFVQFYKSKNKTQREINKTLKHLRENYMSILDKESYTYRNIMNRIEQSNYKQKIRAINEKKFSNYFINFQMSLHLIKIFYDKFTYYQMLKNYNINKTFSYSAIISNSIRTNYSNKEIKVFYNYITKFKNFDMDYLFENFDTICYKKIRSNNYQNTFNLNLSKISLDKIHQLNKSQKKKLQTIKYNNPSFFEKNFNINERTKTKYIRKYTLKDFLETRMKSIGNKTDINKSCLSKTFFYRKNDKYNLKDRTIFIKNLKLRPTIKVQNIDFHINDQQADMQKNRNMTKESLQYRTEEIKIELKKSLKTIEEILFFLIKENNIREFKNILEKFQVNINSTDKDKNTFLIFAIQCGSIDLALYLIEKGAKINEQNKYLNTALHYALLNQDYKMADLLLKNGANEKIKNSDGLIPWQMDKAYK